MKKITSPLCSFTLNTNWSHRFARGLVALMVVLTLTNCTAALGATLLSKTPNAAVYFGLPFNSLEFENPLTGSEMVLSHKVLDWRDADFAWGPPPWYDDWTVSHPGSIDGNQNEIYLRAQGHSAWTTTTVPSTIVSIHLNSDDNDGRAEVRVDGVQVATFDMYTPQCCQTVLIVVRGLSNTTHTVTVNDLGRGVGGTDVHIMGAAALAESDLKWNQPPLPAAPENVYYGWNQQSMQYFPPIAADDWVCTNNLPITKIRWWGSFIGWNEPRPPYNINAFRIRFWSDVPKGVQPEFPFSHPGTNVWEIYCSNYTCQWAGWDYDPRSNRYEACFMYEQNLPQDEWFYQNPGPTGTNIYWISIEAVVPEPPVLWGWKTRPRAPDSPAPDDAVIFDPLEPWYQPLWWPTEKDSWDLAFELICDASISTAKWTQLPDLTENGIDVNCTRNPPPPNPFLLADDFLCTTPGPITNITIWGSWKGDSFPDNNPANVTFTLSIHTDTTNTVPPYNSMPGLCLWTNTFTPGQFTCTQVTTNVYEYWWNPNESSAIFRGDSTCYRYDFAIPLTNAFNQQGTPSQPIVYWLDVQARPGGVATNKFGWKTSTNHWHDDACWVMASEPYSGPWNELRYPPNHPYHGNSIDLAFRINLVEQQVSEVKWSQPPVIFVPPNGYHGWNQFSVDGQQIVADDWVCTNDNPVTDIHWWGSFIGWSMPGIPEQPAPTLPIAFRFIIWSDVPAGVDAPFSHPSTNVCWQHYTANFAWEFVGWDFDPRNPMATPEACFKYHVDLPPEKWFYQTNGPTGSNTYWLSIAAIYPSGQQIEYPWGWKTRLRDLNSPAPDDAVYSDPLSFPPWRPIEYPVGTSWDMAFALTTKEMPRQDFGDAPDPTYPTLLTNDGARHVVVPGILLGTNIDAELDGQPNATATGDDLNNLADEDGVALGSQLVPGESANIQVTASVNGFVSAWIDFGADGSWAETGDQIANNVSVSAGPNTIFFNVPTNAARGTYTFARVRFSTGVITNYTGWAADGEVEDYRWYIEELDYGDAADPSFPTLRINNGARHVLMTDPTGRLIRMGAQIDSEPDGQPNATATGDDIANLPDEDGVTLLTPLVPGQAAVVQVVASIANGFLNAWIDFGADGSWAQPGDQIASGLVLPIAGPNVVSFVVPANAAAGSNVFARFRFSTQPGALPFWGLLPNGEVEDYLWHISELDFGDAPTNYPTLLAQNGARHVIVPGFCLGSLEDGETDGLPHTQALGDDLNNSDDEDGVLFTTPLVIGTQACVKVVLAGTNNGLLDAWIDFDANSSWLETADQIFNSQALVPGTNNLCFSVPASAKPGRTFARFRLSSTGRLPPTGQANDGEVEDYQVALGWPRPSTNIVITNITFTTKFNGWNEPSPSSSNTIAADDWVCTTTNPVTEIRWWGSFLGWRSNAPPTPPSAFQIRFWTDVPAGMGLPFSHPGEKIWEIYCTNFTWQFVGWDIDPRTLEYEACFKFEQKLSSNEWFYQTNWPTGTNIYWLSIAAIYQGGTPDHVWGWKTRPRATNSPAPDDAVRFIPAQGWYEPIWWPDPTNSWDLAFELVSSYTNLLYKWEQLPDLSVQGIDVNATRYTGLTNPPPYLLADDFQCNATGPLTDITIWGSWTNDWETPDVLSFTLSIHKDVPAQGTTNSMPGQVLWTQNFAPGRYQWQILPIQVTEGWLTPPTNYIFPGDHACWQFNFHIATNAFVQTNGTIYWLDVQAHLPQPPIGQAAPAFGWKTSPARWNDAAVWVNAIEPYNGSAWQALKYPPRHLYAGQPIDMAFRLANSQPVYQLKWSQPPVSNRYVTIEWTSEAGIHYQLQATTYLSNAPTPCIWVDVGPEVIGPVHEQSDTNTSAPHRFYRVVAPNVAP